MATTVYWPLQLTAGGCGAADAVPGASKGEKQMRKPHERELLGYRVDVRTFCVVAARAEPLDTQTLPKGLEILGQVSDDSDDSDDDAAARKKRLKGAESSDSFCLRAVVTSASSQSVPRICVEDGTSSSARSCNVVLYDAAAAASGAFSRSRQADSSSSLTASLHAPLVLDLIGSYFESERDRQGRELARGRIGDALGGVQRFLEFVCYYALYTPFAALMVVSNAAKYAVESFQTPPWLLVGGGKSLADISQFLAVLVHQLHNAATLPSCLRHYYLVGKQRRFSHQERLELLETWNCLCLLALDIALGRLMSSCLGEIVTPALLNADISPNAVVEALRANVKWLMGAPAGFKLNKPLASILGNGILLWLDLWGLLLTLLFPSGGVVQWLLPMCRHLSITLQLSLATDVVSLATWHSHWVYLYFAKLNRLQFALFSSLFKLFLGKKVNVLRKRVDSCEYGVGQLLLGTLLFTMLVFLVTTNLVFFVFFALVRSSVVLVLLLLWLPIVALSSMPVASLVYRMWNPRFFVVGMQIRMREDWMSLGKDVQTIVVQNVGVGHKSPHEEAHCRRALCKALESWESRGSDGDGDGSSRNAYFELVSVVSGASVHFTRLCGYLQAVTTRHSANAMLQTWIFGKASIARVPLEVLLGLSELPTEAVKPQ